MRTRACPFFRICPSSAVLPRPDGSGLTPFPLIVPAGTVWHRRPAALCCGTGANLWVFPLGMSRGVQTAGPHTRKKPGEFPKLNSMTHRFHSVKVEGHVVDGIQDLRQQFSGRIYMAQVGA